MNTNWAEFLQSHQADIADSYHTNFPAEDSGSDKVQELAICNLSYLTTIAVSGEDASSFLQGQFGNDINALTSEVSQISSFCSPKGRILARFLITKRGSEYLIQVPKDVSEAFIKRLRMFVLMSKVTIDDITDQVAVIGISGSNAPSAISKAGFTTPEGDYRVNTQDGLLLVQQPSKTNRFLCTADIETMIKLWESLTLDAVKQPSSHWLHEDIMMGIPNIFSGTVEAFVPQMVNLQLINGVSFKKGCYPGQEIVARMQYLGKLKRRMYLAHTDTGTQPLPGDNIYSPTSSSGQGAGKVVDAQASANGGFDLLAVLELSSAENGELFLDEANEAMIELLELPYSVETD